MDDDQLERTELLDNTELLDDNDLLDNAHTIRGHRRPRRRSRWLIATGVFAAVLAGGAGVGLAIQHHTAGDNGPTTQAALDDRSDRASRGDVRASESASASPSPSPSAASPSPVVTPSAAHTTTVAPPRPAPARTTTKAPAPPPPPAGCTSYSGNRRIGCSLLPSFGFSTSQMPALDQLWEHESGWNEHASNPSSGAYGIPQALPGDKMAEYGSDWRTNPATQIKWGLDYIKSRYGSPSAAWSYWQANGWY